ncbi:MAG: hypothetical protein DRN04_02275 [Thermoprotei archaeon]|nr:MAG: hypothetical protein DRN04_02275 [Thermoprotei archaeon]
MANKDPYVLLNTVVSNPLRRQIVEVLGREGAKTFTELKRQLKVSTGTLYYHLENLRGVIEQTEDKKYRLTEDGLKLFKIFEKEKDLLKEVFGGKPKVVEFFDKYIKPYFIPTKLFTSLYKQPLLEGIAVILSVILAAIPSALWGFEIVLLESRNTVFLTISDKIFAVTESMLSWLVVAVILDLLSRALGSKSSLPEFYAASSASFIPIYLVVLLIGLTKPYFNNSEIFLYSAALLYRLAQIFTIGFLIATLTVYKKISEAKAFLLVTVVFYLSYFVNYFLPRVIP